MNNSSTCRRPIIRVLSYVPILDCLLNQINTTLHLTVGSLSMLQAVRAPIVIVVAATCAMRLITGRARLASLPVASIGAVLLVAIAAVKELLATNSIAPSSSGAYGQLLYWALLWAFVSLECRTSEEARTILHGVAVCAILSSASILIGYCFGGLNPYADDGVSASAGWFNTAKTITGVLLCGAIALLYLGAARRPWIYAVLAALCCGSSVLTYARAGAVALVLLLGWIVFWYATAGRKQRRSAVGAFLLIIVALGVVSIPALIHSTSFLNRWDDVQDFEKGGSGRAAFWPIAIEDYKAAPAGNLLLGFGYECMATMLNRDYGEDIRHTHNDFLDMLLVGGVAGVLWWALLVGSMLAIGLRRWSTLEGGAAIAICIVFGCHGQLTGQLFGTDCMVAYTFSLASLSALARLHAGRIAPAMSRSFLPGFVPLYLPSKRPTALCQ